MPVVSIIIPVYNAGDRLKDCLNSLLKQSLLDIEIICVLDAPTDGSDKIVFEYALKDSRIKWIINQSNVHIAESRNRGMAIANGEYIGFSDHDDTRDLNMYELLYNKAKESDADIVFSNSVVNNYNEIDVEKYNNPTKEGILRSIILPMFIRSNQNNLSKSVWASIYKRTFIEEKSLEFKDRRIYYEEDTLFNLKAFLSTDRISFLDKELYVWTKLAESESSRPDIDVAIKQICFLREMINCLLKAGELDNYRVELNLLISEWISSKSNFYNYIKLTRIQKQGLSKLLRTIRFPFYGKSEGIRFVGRRRLRLSVFVIILYLFYF
jgi:glycosyltransferase involved in cell wall biosynthesis